MTKIAKGYLDMGEISEETYNKILKMRDEDRKDLAKTVEGWMKATEKAKTYSDKLLDLRRKAQTEIDKINEKEARGGDFTRLCRKSVCRILAQGNGRSCQTAIRGVQGLADVCAGIR